MLYIVNWEWVTGDFISMIGLLLKILTALNGVNI